MAADQRDRELADVMAVARALHEPESVDDVLGRLVRVARDAIPAEFVGVSIASPKGIRTAAASDPVVTTLDHAQYELGEGPCVDAMRHHTATAVADFRTDNRWPRFGPRAVAAGVISQMGIEIFRQHSTVGGLNLYASRPNAFDDETRHACSLVRTPCRTRLGQEPDDHKPHGSPPDPANHRPSDRHRHAALHRR